MSTSNMWVISSSYKINQLISNPKLSNVFPQLDKSTPLRNVYSNAVIERRTLEYLKNAFKGHLTADGELIVRGKHKTVLARITAMTGVIEQFFNRLPTIAALSRRNTSIYLPVANLQVMADMKSTPQKVRMLRALMDNIKYNPDIVGRTGKKSQENWINKVGYKENKK